MRIAYTMGMKQGKPHARTVALAAKFSPVEAAALRTKASVSGTTVSGLLHELAMKGKIHPRPQIDPIAIEQWRQLAPLASNLNQLVRGIHCDEPVSRDAITRTVTELRSTLGQIRDTLIDTRRAA